jgi:uncharacterized protein YkwD
MKALWLAVAIATTSTAAYAENMAEVISQYRRERGLSAVKSDPQLTAIAERQAKAMAASGALEHDVAGSFASRIAAVNAESAAENIAAGTKTWAETFRMWQKSPGHNANLLKARADSVGVAFARNENTRYKTYWAMVIAEKSPKRKRPQVVSEESAVEKRGNSAALPNPVNSLKNFVCKYVC